MLYNIVTKQVSQWMVLLELLMNSSVCMSSAILYVRCGFSLVSQDCVGFYITPI